VNAIAPGFIETDMTADLPDAARQAIVDQTPLGRIGSPGEVAAAVVFLASDEASYITGQVVRVNGGMHV
jgi:3-oxoacyl-[acyl-carrier protein] reductase